MNRKPATLLSMLFWLAFALTLGGCAAGPVAQYARPAPQFALAPRDGDAFAAIEAQIRRAHGEQASGFDLLDRNEDGLRWRLALIDSARDSIDVQYYVWFGDVSGRLLIKRLLDAADRGVRVRLLLDDLNTLLETAETVKLRDDVALWLDAHPNLEMRLFNPWRHRSLAGRVGESVTELDRVNHRMHNKAMIVDGRATILGGRNIGDEYMGLNEAFNFRDLDVLGIGPVARQAAAEFDLYWNSDWAMPVAALRRASSPAGDTGPESEPRKALARELERAPQLRRFAVGRQDWSAELGALRTRLHAGTSRVVSDVPQTGRIRQDMVEAMYEVASGARSELLISNAYIIPNQRMIDSTRLLRTRGVSVRVLTNSLASHDVPAVNSHYKAWRRPLLEAGADLHEIRHDAAVQPAVSDTAPTRARFMGLHVKAMVIDRRRVYVGSMNFDPRSANINSEMGVIIDSAGLAGALAALIERDMLPANSWRLAIDGGGVLSWTNDRQTLTRQPARNAWQRVQDLFFMAFPASLY